MVLRKAFFERSAVLVAKDLIGCYLCTVDGRLMIIETEAYEGLEDKASHASRGKTARNEVMFGDPGIWYVYFTYGMHYMLNIVCGANGHPAAVLIRGVEGAIGPGRLTKKLGVDKRFNKQKANRKTGLWIEPSPLSLRDRDKIMCTPRIGVDYSGPIWSTKKWRFVLKKSD